MQRDDRADGNAYDPEAELRNRLMGQQPQAPDPPAAAPDPVWDSPSPPPDLPQPSQQNETQHITDPPVGVLPGAVIPNPPGAIPTNSDGSQVGGGTPWTPGASQPGGAPPGYTWDANMAMYTPTPGTPAVGAQAPAPAPAPTLSGYAGGADQTILQLLQGGMSPQQAIQTFNQKNGRGTGNEAVYYNDNRGQTIGLPSGYAALTPNGWTWTVRTPEGGGGAAPAPTAAAPRSNIAAPAPYQPQQVAGLTAPQGAWNSDFVNQIRALLMSRLQAAGQPVDPNDPSITAPLTAARDEATRSSDKERTALAENLYANGGLNTDAISQKIQQSGEKNAQGLGSLRAQLITRELQSRKDELGRLMQMAVQSGDAESAAAIQMQISSLNAEIQRESMGVDLAKYQGYLNALGSEQVMN